MDWKELEALQACYAPLIESMEPTEVVVYMIQEKAITFDEKESIEHAGPRHKQAEKLLDIMICTKRSTAYRSLCLGLQANMQEFLVDMLADKLDELEKRGPPPLPKDWLIEELNDAGRARQVSEAELSSIAQEMGHIWTSVALMMGFSQGRVEQFQASSPYHVPGQVTKMLIEWKTREGRQANVENLVRIFRNTKVDESVYKQIILDYSNKNQKYAVL